MKYPTLIKISLAVLMCLFQPASPKRGGLVWAVYAAVIVMSDYFWHWASPRDESLGLFVVAAIFFVATGYGIGWALGGSQTEDND